jgi:hypothetical protein
MSNDKPSFCLKAPTTAKFWKTVGVAWLRRNDQGLFISCKLDFIPTGWDGNFSIVPMNNSEDGAAGLESLRPDSEEQGD